MWLGPAHCCWLPQSSHPSLFAQCCWCESPSPGWHRGEDSTLRDDSGGEHRRKSERGGRQTEHHKQLIQHAAQGILNCKKRPFAAKV